METVNVQKVFKKDWNGKTFYDVTLADGRKGSCNDAKIMDYIGKSVTLELKPAKEYKGVQQYYFNFPKGAVHPPSAKPSDEPSQLDRIEEKLDELAKAVRLLAPNF